MKKIITLLTLLVLLSAVNAFAVTAGDFSTDPSEGGSDTFSSFTTDNSGGGTDTFSTDPSEGGTDTSDKVPPALSIPSDIYAEATGLKTIVVLGTATATDDSGYSTTTNNAPIDGFVVGITNVVWTAKDASENTATATQKVTITNPLKSILISTQANKLSFTVGDNLDTTGMIVTGTYADTSTSTETFSVSDFNSTSPVTGQTLTVTVGSSTTSYTIDVVAAPVVLSSNTGGNSGGSRRAPAPQGQVLGAQSVNWDSLSAQEKADMLKTLQALLAEIIKTLNELIANGTLK